MDYQIPKRIIQTGKSLNQSLRNRAMMANIRLLNPEYEFMFFDDERVQSFIDGEFPQYRSVFDSFHFPIQRFDFFRYLAVYRFGGFYFDLDVMLASSLSELLQYGCVFPFEGLTFSSFLRSNYQIDWEIGNYAFGAAPGHPFLKAVIDNCVKAQKDPNWIKPMLRRVPPLSRTEFSILNTTGPGLITRTLAEDTELQKMVKVLWPDDVCDLRNWNRFGTVGIHAMEGSWRPKRSHLHNRLAQRWEYWKMQQLLKQSRKFGKTRCNFSTDSSAASLERCSPKTDSRPLVSILIPAFNAQDWIADSIKSALAQTWGAKEIIVVDDGSTDRTLQIARQFESELVRLVTQRQQGAAAARNKALSLSRGDYIQWLDADNLLSPDKISLQMEVAEKCENKGVLLSSGWGTFLYRHQKAKFIPTLLWCDLSPFEWLLRKMGDNLRLQTACWLVSRELTEAAGPWDSRLLVDDDGEYFCRILLAAQQVRFVAGAKVFYRGPGLPFRSLSYIGRADKKIEALWLSMKLHIEYLRSMEDSDRVREVCLTYIRTSLLHFYPGRLDIVEQAEAMAKELGGSLGPPGLSWKYSWIRSVFGWRVAKTGQQLLLKSRLTAAKKWDHMLFYFEKTNRSVREVLSDLSNRARTRYQSAISRYLFRRPFTVDALKPIISFTFDDFPRSALLTGGAILNSFGASGTFYASLGLIGKEIETGTMFLTEDLSTAVEQGHELGCHTFSHSHAWNTEPSKFENSVIENLKALEGVVPGASFKTLSYPISMPRPQTKRRVSKYFSCCRAGGQTFNIGEVDLSSLSAFFLEQSRNDPEAIKNIVDQNCRAGGWLIFATHDISENPSPWGCTPEFFEEIVRYSVNSGAEILPIFQAYDVLRRRSLSSGSKDASLLQDGPQVGVE